MRIRELERLLGTTLFDRSGYRVVPPRPGAKWSATPNASWPGGGDGARSAGAMAIEGPIRLGAADTFALTCLSPLVAQIEQLFPALRVDLQIDFSFNLNAAAEGRAGRRVPDRPGG